MRCGSSEHEVVPHPGIIQARNIFFVDNYATILEGEEDVWDFQSRKGCDDSSLKGNEDKIIHN